MADRKKIHTERIFEDVKLGDDDNDDCDCTGGDKKEKKEDNCCRVFGRLIWLGILTALGIAMILVGADNKDNCPAEKMVPIFLIGMLFIGTFKGIELMLLLFLLQLTGLP